MLLVLHAHLMIRLSTGSLSTSIRSGYCMMGRKSMILTLRSWGCQCRDSRRRGKRRYHLSVDSCNTAVKEKSTTAPSPAFLSHRLRRRRRFTLAPQVDLRPSLRLPSGLVGFPRTFQLRDPFGIYTATLSLVSGPGHIRAPHSGVSETRVEVQESQNDTPAPKIEGPSLN